MDAGDRLFSGVHPVHSASPRLFRNPALDLLSRVHHLVPLLVYVPLATALLAFAALRLKAPSMLAAVAAGYLLWTLVEYLGHRLLFHYGARSAFGKRIQFLIHGVHHDHPSDPLRLVMPPLMSLPIMMAAAGVLRLALGPALWTPTLAGFAIGYLAYDMLHFHIHHRQPKSSLGRLLRYRHMYHHFRDDSCWFGVSAPWWDAVFASRPAARKSGAAVAASSRRTRRS